MRNIKYIGLGLVAALSLGGLTLNAEDFQVRLGMSSTSGTYTVENEAGNKTSNIDLNDGSGFEVSLVSGVDKRKGFDFRPVLTLQSNDISLNSSVKTSDIMFLGEFEFAYNINEYISPFIGFYGGIGSTKIPDMDESGLLTYDLGILIGASGTIYRDFGYYTKYTNGMKGYNVSDNTFGVRQSPSSIKIGVSYTF